MPAIQKLLGFRAHTNINKFVKKKNIVSLLRKRNIIVKMITICLALLPRKLA